MTQRNEAGQYWVAALASLEQAEAIGCLIDPTQWQLGRNDRRIAKEALEGLLKFIDGSSEMRKLIKNIRSTENGVGN